MTDSTTNPFPEQKWIGKSLTALGVVIAALPQIAPLIGVTFTENDATMAGEAVDMIVTGIGSIVAIVGRLRAKTTATALPKG